MRVFYENLVNPIENSYSNTSTVENVLYLEDIIKSVSTDIYAQYKLKSRSVINYSLSSMTIEGVVKVRNHLYFINNYRATYNNYISFDNNKDNLIKMVVTNNQVTNEDPYTIDIYLNTVKIETLEYWDTYSINNQKTILIDSTTLGTKISVNWPLYIAEGEYVEYKVYTINITEEPSLHKYLCTFDRPNNSLIFDRKYNDYTISVLLQSRGSILRSSTINELFRLNSNSFIQFDENTNNLIIPIDKVFKEGSKLRYIKSQYVTIDPHQLTIGYALLGIYLDDAGYLAYDDIIHNTNYANLMDSINNFTLDTLRKTRQYYGFIIGQNNINKFIPYSLFLYSLGAGSGSGTGGSAEKIAQQFTAVDEIEINYSAGTNVPTVVVFDNDGNQMVPQEIHYNYNNKITITLGEIISGWVSVI